MPSLADIIKICEQYRPATITRTTAYNAIATAQHNATSYTKEFMKSHPVALQATNEGWHSALRSYVDAIAYIQAQMVVGARSDIGYNGMAIFGCGYHEDAALDEILRDSRQQAQTGNIQVVVTDPTISELRRRKW